MSPKPQKVPSWFSIAGYAAGILTLLFFMAIVFASIFSHVVPPGGRFAVVVVLAFGLALSFAFIGGTAAAHGNIPLPSSDLKPLTFSVAGGIAVFVITLALGYQMYVPTDKFFTVTIRPLVNGIPLKVPGKIRLEYGNANPTEEINSHGQAEFKNVPAQYMDKETKAWPIVPGYEEKPIKVTLSETGIDLPLEVVVTILKGRIVPLPEGKDVRVFVENESKNESKAVTPDDTGRFEVTILGKSEGMVRVTVLVNGKKKFDDPVALPGPVVIPLAK